MSKSAPRAKSGIPAGARVAKFGSEKGPKGLFSRRGYLMCKGEGSLTRREGVHYA